MSSNIYIDTENLYFPLYQGDIRSKHPNMGEDFVLPEGYAELEETPTPEIISGFVLEENVPYKKDGLWHRAYFLRPMAGHELAFSEAATQAQADHVAEQTKTRRFPVDSPEHQQWLKEKGSAPNVIG
jgi:hypothetical protein